MRRLLRLSVEGFKTFAARTDLELGPGMTAVVGPNGSGKSNLIDAIAWAVGARSWKSLRGDGMEDVIFHGSDREPAAPSAKVTVSFENEDRLLGIDFSEVTITREITRGGGSRLLLNGVDARLKDVQAVLSGTGLAGGFSLLRQGTVDRLILSPPEEVGRWIEESANIAGYRARKQEAVDRLRKVDAHAQEAERRSASLRRELNQVLDRAARARSRRALEERRASLRSVLAELERRGILESLAAVESESAALRAELELRSSRRSERAALRRTLEAELQTSDGASIDRPVEVDEPVRRIRAASRNLRSIAEELARRGPEGWAEAASALDRACAILQELRSPGSRDRRDAILAELRRCDADLEALDRESADLAAGLSNRRCERARLEERLAGVASPEAPPPGDLDAAVARAELETLARELSALGPVDETAEEREREIREELAGLTPILQDLGGTRATLAGFIRQMERHTSRVFDHTLTAVESRFREYCGILFQGGEARLERREAAPGGEDPLGVDVRVKLPRKPETSLALLSGGERSLAGLALVLSLAAGGGGRDPGRILILDEVDAALDEPNAARLALLLRELRQSHQILCVTHNRLTMHQASRLVGVASGHGSASSLVKVDLERPGSAA